MLSGCESFPRGAAGPGGYRDHVRDDLPFANVFVPGERSLCRLFRSSCHKHTVGLGLEFESKERLAMVRSYGAGMSVVRLSRR